MKLRDCILAVDDNYQNLEVLVELLSDEFTVVTARSGDEAIRIAPHLRPALILLDVMMPGIDGIETCRQLHASPELPDVKIVMLSAKKGLPDRLAAYQRGAMDYIAKPFDGREVQAKIRAWMQVVHRRQLEHIWDEAERAREAVGFAMVTLTGFRDTETGDHLFRMRWYSQAIAEQLSLSGPYEAEVDEAFMQQLYRASPLHDIGKVAIDDAILRKPGPLTPTEFDAMKLHAAFGGEILGKAAGRLVDVPYLQMAAIVARHHHERFDGSGYPDGLVGEAIPLAARIVAVADTFDAMTSDRVYRKALSIDQATQYIGSAAGTQFDPAVVRAFLRRVADFRLAAARFSDGYLSGVSIRPSGEPNQTPSVDASVDHAEFVFETH